MSNNGRDDWWSGDRLTVRLVIWTALAGLLAADRLGAPGYGLQGDLPLHYHLTRNMIQALAEGDPYPGWAGLLDGGRGNLFFTFYPPLFYWVSSLICLGTGASILFSLQAMTIGSLIFNQWAAWQLARQFGRGWKSVVASGLYVALPGLTLIGLNRGFLPQALAAGFLPLALAGVERIRRGEPGRRAELLLGAGLVGVVLTHAITAWMTMVAIGIYLISSGWRDGRMVGRVVRTGLIGAGLTAFFWLPQVLEMGGVQVGRQVERQDYRHYLLFAAAGDESAYRQAWQGLNEVASVVILAQSGLALVAALGLILTRRRPAEPEEPAEPKEWTFARFGLGVALFGVLIALPPLAMLWEMIPGLRFIQFPWRWQPVTALVGAVLTVGWWSNRRAGRPGWRLAGGTLIALLVVVSVTLAILLGRTQSPADEAKRLPLLTETAPTAGGGINYEAALAMQDQGAAEFLRLTANQVYFRPRGAETRLYPAVEQPGSLERVTGEVAIEEVRLALARREFRIRAASPARLRLASYAAPHWRAALNGQPLPVEVEPDSGLLLVTVPAGEHELRFDYRRPRLPLGISLLTLGGLTLFGLRRGRRRDRP